MKHVTPAWPAKHDPVDNSEHCCWPGCGGPIHDQGDIPLCRSHFIRVGSEFQRQLSAHLPTPGPRARPTSVVYYVRLGDHIKIGTSSNLRERLRTFYIDHNPDALLVTEPGSHDVEAIRHRQFADERISRSRELFNPSRRLLAHIEGLRQAAA